MLPRDHGLHAWRDPAIDIDCAAPPLERWKPLVDRHGADIHHLMDQMEVLKDQVLADLSAPMRAMVRALSIAGKIVPWTLEMAGFPEYVAEIRAIARLAGVPADLLFIGNLSYDITQRFGLCSSGSVVGRHGPILVRTMDWCEPEVGPHTVLLRMHHGQRRYLSVGIAGFVGVLSAVLPGTWAATLNQAPPEKVSGGMFQFPSCMLFRQACDAATSFSGLLDGLTHLQSMSPFFVHAVGATPAQQALVTHFGRRAVVRAVARAGANGPLVLTNHYTHEDDTHLNPEDDIEESCERADALETWLSERSWSTGTGAARVIGTCPVIVDGTQHLMVLEPGNADSPLHCWYRR